MKYVRSHVLDIDTLPVTFKLDAEAFYAFKFLSNKTKTETFLVSFQFYNNV